MQHRLADLMVPFCRKDYDLPAMQGFYASKYVLPPVLRYLSFDTLSIVNCIDSSVAFSNLKDETDSIKTKMVRKNLTDYCGLDTLAMLMVLDNLRKL